MTPSAPNMNPSINSATPSIGVDEYVILIIAEIVRYIDTDAVGLGNGLTWEDAYTSMYSWNSAEATDLTDTNDLEIIKKNQLYMKAREDFVQNVNKHIQETYTPNI